MFIKKKEEEKKEREHLEALFCRFSHIERLASFVAPRKFLFPLYIYIYIYIYIFAREYLTEAETEAVQSAYSSNIQQFFY